MISGRSIARNMVFNFCGQAAPLLFAIFAIPILVRELGTERFGILLLAWMAIGYFSLFDLGLGRALTKLVSERLGTERNEEVPVLVWTGLFIMMVLGIVSALVAIALSPWLVEKALRVPEDLHQETLHAFYLLALSVPIVILTAGFRGVLEAGQHFFIVTAIRIPMGMLTFLGPLPVLPFSKSLVPIVAVLAVGRIVAGCSYALVCLRVMPELRGKISVRRSVVGSLLRFGGWITVANVVTPIISYLDRFLVGALISVSAVAYYATPYEVVTKLWVVPIALTGVLFPLFSAGYSSDLSRTSRLFWKAVKYVFAIMLPVAVLLDYAGRELLLLWLGASFAENSTFVLQLLAIGVFLNSVAQIPSAFIQGVGRPDLKAKIHLFELPLFVGFLWWCVSQFGIEGAAVAFLVRIAVDAVLFFLACFSVVPEIQLPDVASLVLLILLSSIVLIFPMLVQSVEVRLIAMAILVPTIGLGIWYVLLDSEDRAFFKGLPIAFKIRK